MPTPINSYRLLIDAVSLRDRIRFTDTDKAGRRIMRVIVEFVKFLKDRKYWLIPIFLWLALVGGLVVATQGSAIAPFIYTLF